MKVKVNGLEIQNITRFFGPGGVTLYQGEIFLDGDLVGFWSQRMDYGTQDLIESRNGYSIEKLAGIIRELYPDTDIYGVRKEPYCLGDFMQQLCDLDLLCKENTDTALVLYTDEDEFCYYETHHTRLDLLSDQDLIAEFLERFPFGKTKILKSKATGEKGLYSIRVLRTDRDVVIGEPISKSDISI